MDDKELRKHQIYNAITLLLIWVAVVVIAFCLGSCRSMKTETVINYRDSIITHTRFDTIRITITDTIYVEASSENESESETEIQFGEGGGTYNALTGEATNVNNVKQSSKEKELQHVITTQAHTIDSLSVANDSLSAVLRVNSIFTTSEQNTKAITPRSGWDKFTTWWFLGSCIVLLLLLAYGAWRLYRKFYLHV